MQHRMSPRRRRTIGTLAGSSTISAIWLLGVNAAPGTPGWWVQAAAVAPVAVALGMLGVMEACGISDLDRPPRAEPTPEPALVGQVLPASPTRVGAR